LEKYAAVIEILAAYDALLILPRLSTFGTTTDGMPMRETSGHDRYGKKMRDLVAMEEVKKDNLTIARAVSLFRDHSLRGATVCLLLPASADDEICMPGSLDEVASCARMETTRSSLLAGGEFGGEPGTLWQAIHHARIELKQGRVVEGRTSASLRPYHEFVASVSDTNIPWKLKVWLRLKLRLQIRQAVSTSAAKSELQKSSGQLLDGRPRVKRSIPLRGTIEDRRPKDIDDEQVIGGLRQPHHSNSWIPGARPAGMAMSKALEVYADTKQGIADVEFLFGLIGGEKMTHTCMEGARQCKECQIIAVAERLRRIVLTALSGSETGPRTKQPADDYVTTHLQPGVFLAWAHATGDPDGVVADWLITGAPCGIDSLPEHTGIFTVCDDPCETNIEDMILCGTSHSTQHVKHTAEEEQLMYDEVSAMEAKGFMRSFASPEEVIDFVGGEFVESKLFILTKTTAGVTKHRVLLDCKQSKVSTSSAKAERVLLPRAKDVVSHALQLATHNHDWTSSTEVEISTEDDDRVEAFVIDVSDAYWSVPAAPEERKYFVCCCRGRYYVILRTAQGSRNAGLTWGRIMAFSARMAQASSSASRLRISTYVDDPIMLARGNANRIRLTFFKVLRYGSRSGTS